jgi:hypothetical protein
MNPNDTRAAAQLPAEVLARSQQLPLKPAPVTLTGRFVRLEPLACTMRPHSLRTCPTAAPSTWPAAPMPAYDADALIWRYLFAGPFADLASFEAYVAQTASPAPTAWRCASSTSRAARRSASSP